MCVCKMCRRRAGRCYSPWRELRTIVIFWLTGLNPAGLIIIAGESDMQASGIAMEGRRASSHGGPRWRCENTFCSSTSLIWMGCSLPRHGVRCVRFFSMSKDGHPRSAPRAGLILRPGCAVPEGLRYEEKKEAQAEASNHGDNPRIYQSCKFDIVPVLTHQKTHLHPRDWMMAALIRGIKFFPPRSSRV